MDVPEFRPRARERCLGGRMGRVLVVDDNTDTCKVLAAVLGRAGHDTECVNSARAALTKVESGALPDVMLLDLMMPHESGFDVLRELRGSDRTRDLPVVIYSAVSEPRYVKQAMEAGATDYWLKGTLRGPDLETRLRAYLPDVTGWAEPPDAHGPSHLTNGH